MSIYQELGLKTIINASDTYTKIGGSRMSRGVLASMTEAAGSFVNLTELAEAVCGKIAAMTNNEAAFISSGAGAGVVLTAAALMALHEPELAERLPDASCAAKNEIVVFDAQTNLEMLPYWRLIGLSGARIVRAQGSINGLREAFGSRTAGMFFFAADIYEAGLPPAKDIIAACHEAGVPVIIDAAAQLPPKNNLWLYTKEMGADGTLFSGGKFLMGPQSTGLFVGKKEIASLCYKLSNPNVGIGRPFKVSKEGYIALYTAVKEFMEADPGAVRVRQNRHLDIAEKALSGISGIALERLNHGRLGQDAPMLRIGLPDGKNGPECARFLYAKCDPAVDIGFYPPEDPSGNGSQIFINSINLREGEPEYVAACIRKYLEE